MTSPARASDKCQREKRKTVNGDDLIWAMTTLGFDDYIEVRRGSDSAGVVLGACCPASPMEPMAVAGHVRSSCGLQIATPASAAAQPGSPPPALPPPALPPSRSRRTWPSSGKQRRRRWQPPTRPSSRTMTHSRAARLPGCWSRPAPCARSCIVAGARFDFVPHAGSFLAAAAS